MLKMQKNKILIIVPAYNEERCIKKVIEETQLLSSCDIVVVDDGSVDSTSTIVKGLGINIISHPINLGAGAAIQTGLKYAYGQKYDIAVVVDGDGQHDPREIIKLIDAMENNFADLVIGSRFISNKKVKTSLVRKIGIRMFSLIVSLIGKCKITDVTSGFRAFNKKTMQLLSKEIPADFPDADLLLCLAMLKYKILEVAVDSRERKGGQSMYSPLRSLYYPFKLSVAILGVIIRTIAVRRESI